MAKVMATRKLDDAEERSANRWARFMGASFMPAMDVFSNRPKVRAREAGTRRFNAIAAKDRASNGKRRNNGVCSGTCV